MYYPPRYKRTYRNILKLLGREITLQVNNGSGSFTDYTGVQAHVSDLRESDLVPGGPAQLGDLRLIILEESMPDGVRDLRRGDRVEIGGRPYGVVHWDVHSRTIGDEILAIEAVVRGG